MGPARRIVVGKAGSPGPAWVAAPLLLGLVLGACTSAVEAPGVATVGAGGATIDGPDGIQMAIGEGAVSQPVTIRMARDSTGAPAIPSDIQLASPIYAFTPHGIELARPARVLVPFDPSTSPGTDYVPVLHKARPGGEWAVVAGTVEGSALVADLTSFSYFTVTWCRFSGWNDYLNTYTQACAGVGLDARFELVSPAPPPAPAPVAGGRVRGKEPALTVTEPTNVTARLVVSAPGGSVPPHQMIIRLMRGASTVLNERRQDVLGPVSIDLNIPLTEGDNGLASYWLQVSCVEKTGAYLGLPTRDCKINDGQTTSVAPYSVSTNALLLSVAIPAGTPTPASVFPAFEVARSGFDMRLYGTPPRAADSPDFVATWDLLTLVEGTSLRLRSETLGDAAHSWEQSSDGGQTWTPLTGRYGMIPPSGPRVSVVDLKVGSANCPPLPFRQTGPSPFDVTPAPPECTTTYAYAFTPSELNGRKFRVTARNAFGATPSPVWTVQAPQAPTPPSWTQQPSPTTSAAAGQTVSLTVVVAGVPTPTIGWQSRASGQTAWTTIAGATGSTYTTAVLQLSDNGRQFRPIASNSATTTPLVGDPVTVLVTAAPVAPVITTQPAGLAVTGGSDAAFAVDAQGTEALSYQWARNGTPITGANAAVLRIASVTAGDAGSYTVTVSNSAGSVTSNAAVLTVTTAPTAVPVAPTVVTQPVHTTVAAGNTATLAVATNGTSPFTYQWFKGGTPIGGATAAAYTVASATAGDAGSYFVTVSNGAGSATSSTVTLAVSAPAAPVAPSITTQPAGIVIAPGGTATFAMAATGTGPLGYQWRRNGVDLAGATAPVLTLADVNAAHAGSYSAVVSNGVGSVTSSSVHLIVLGAPAITTQPSGVSVGEGQPATFSVGASGTDLRYQWLRNGVAIGNATAASYTTPATSIAADNGAVFSVVVYNGAGAAFSNAVVLAVTPVVPPTIGAQPRSVTVSDGETASFGVTASGTGPLAYQWRRNGTDIAGATAATYSFTATASDDGASFSVVVSGPGGTTTSTAATLTVLSLPDTRASLVSATPTGVVANGPSYAPSVSADGRWIAFVTDSLAPTNLVADGFGGGAFVHDVMTRVSTRINLRADGGYSSQSVVHLKLAADGRHALFSSFANDLVAGDTNIALDVFVRDLQTGVTTRENVLPDGSQDAVSGNGVNPFPPDISADGRFVLMWSQVDLAVDGAYVGGGLFLRDRQAGATRSVVPPGTPVVGAALSASGRFAAYVAASGSGSSYAYHLDVHDIEANTTTRLLDVPYDGGRGAIHVGVSVSDDGRFVAFSALSPTLVGGAATTSYQVMVLDRSVVDPVAALEIVSVTDDEVPGGGGSSTRPRLSGDGRYVLFASRAGNLGVSPFFSDTLLVRDRLLGTTRVASRRVDGTPAHGGIGMDSEVLSRDGSTVVFMGDMWKIVDPASTSGWQVFRVGRP